ncbi:MAG TPA: DUF2225 domain-containing protein [Myxococcales bacterium]|jgi:hypothetical protein
MRAATAALIVSSLFLAAPALATTWMGDEVECPVCKSKNAFKGIGSYGSYVYRWPSKCQYVYWPFTDDPSVYSCSHCRYTAFISDFGALPADKVDAVKKALEGTALPEATEYSRIPMTARLEVAEKVYQAIGQDDLKWSRFYRVLAYHYGQDGEDAKASAARRKALAAAQRAAALPENAGIKKELLVITGAMRMFLGESEAAAGDFDAAAKLKIALKDPEESEGFDGYLTTLIEELRKGLPPAQVSRKDDRCEPVCSPECWKRPALAPWQKLERGLLMKDAGELGMERYRKCPRDVPPGASSFCTPRHESAPALKPSRRWTTIADVVKQHGPATAVEIAEGGKAKRFFWGPIYLVAKDEKSVPEAQGVDAILMADDRKEENKINGAVYARLGATGPAAVEVRGTPAGARIELTDEGPEPKEAKVPGRIEGLATKTYKLLVEAPGHHRFETEVFAEPGFVARFDVELKANQPWEAVVADHFALSLEALRRKAFDRCGSCFDGERFEIAPILPAGKSTKVREMVTRNGPAVVEDGLYEKKPVKRFFWGPAFVVAAGMDAVPVAGGVDFLLDKLLRRGFETAEVRSATYKVRPDAKPSSTTGGLEVTCSLPEAEVTATGPTGKMLKGKTPWKGAALPAGEYEIQVSKPGHSEFKTKVLVEPGFDTSVNAYLYSTKDG